MANQIKTVKLVNNVLFCLIPGSLTGLSKSCPLIFLINKCNHGGAGRQKEKTTFGLRLQLPGKAFSF